MNVSTLMTDVKEFESLKPKTNITEPIKPKRTKREAKSMQEIEFFL